ncbi:MAG: hypothetical protein ACRDNK_24825 [Solirubrobacteraceae bacterium]
MQSKKPYEAPVVKELGSLHQLTQLIQKHDNHTPDGFAYNGIILTS